LRLLFHSAAFLRHRIRRLGRQRLPLFIAVLVDKFLDVLFRGTNRGGILRLSSVLESVGGTAVRPPAACPDRSAARPSRGRDCRRETLIPARIYPSPARRLSTAGPAARSKRTRGCKRNRPARRGPAPRRRRPWRVGEQEFRGGAGGFQRGAGGGEAAGNRGGDVRGEVGADRRRQNLGDSPRQLPLWSRMR